MSRGIDYGIGRLANGNLPNRDPDTGIRYGVIPANAVDWWWEAAEGDYGEPTCPECETDEHMRCSDDEEAPDWADKDYYCLGCEKCFASDAVFPDSPHSHDVDKEGVKASCGESNDIFVFESPYFTRAAFCSPCAPGACYLTSPCEDGERAYCLGHEWFEGAAPYPVYRVDTGEEVKHDSAT